MIVVGSRSKSTSAEQKSQLTSENNHQRSTSNRNSPSIYESSGLPVIQSSIPREISHQIGSKYNQLLNLQSAKNRFLDSEMLNSVPSNFSISSLASQSVPNSSTVSELKLKLDELMDCSSSEPMSSNSSLPEDFSVEKCHFCEQTFADRIGLYQHKRYNCSKNPEVLLHQAVAYTKSVQDVAGTQITEKDLSSIIKSEMNSSSFSPSTPMSTCKFGTLSLANQNAQNLERKKRTVYTDKQLETLREYYVKQPNPNSDDIEKIANNIGLTKRNVQVWFQNKRARDKKNPGIFDYLDSSISATSPTHSVTSEISVKVQSKSPAVEGIDQSPVSLVNTNLSVNKVKNEGVLASSPMKPEALISNSNTNKLPSGESNVVPNLYSYQWLSFLSIYQAMAAQSMLNGGLNPASLLQNQLANLAILNQLKTETATSNLESSEKSPSTKPSPVQSELGGLVTPNKSDASLETSSKASEDEPLDLSLVKTEHEHDMSKSSSTSPGSDTGSVVNASNGISNDGSISGVSNSSDSLIMDLSSSILPPTLMSPGSQDLNSSASSSPLSLSNSSFLGGLMGHQHNQKSKLCSQFILLELFSSIVSLKGFRAEKYLYYIVELNLFLFRFSIIFQDSFTEKNHLFIYFLFNCFSIFFDKSVSVFQLTVALQLVLPPPRQLSHAEVAVRVVCWQPPVPPTPPTGVHLHAPSARRCSRNRAHSSDISTNIPVTQSVSI